MKTFAIVLFTFIFGVAVSKDYSGYQVLRVKSSTEEQQRWLKDIETDLGDMVDFWSEIKKLPASTADIMVPPSFLSGFRSILDARGLSFSVMMEDVGETIAQQQLDRLGRGDVGTQDLSTFDYSRYHTYEEIQQWVHDVVAAYPSLVTRFELPYKSYEGRTISGIKIVGTGGSAGTRKAVWFEGGIHAREWISPATVMYFTSSLLQNYTADVTEVQRLFDTLDWYIVPSLNVDGYAYTWTNDRLWRKTRSSNAETTSGCTGTDPNRNWPYKWGGPGTSPYPCSNVYHGAAELSEQEVEGVVDFLRSRKAAGQDFVWFIDWHSYSQLIISPWSFSADEPDPVDLPDMMAAAEAMAGAIYDFGNRNYTYGPTSKLLYEAAGASNDWGYPAYDPTSRLKGGLGAKYSYVVELPDTGEYGFLLPEDQILGTGDENFLGVLAMGKYILDNEGL